MDVLYVVPYAPSPIRVRPYQLLRTLARRGHMVTLAAVWTSAEDYGHLEALAEAGIEVVSAQQPACRSALNSAAGLFTSAPIQTFYSWVPSLARDLAQLVRTRRFNVVHVEHLRGSRYGTFLRASMTQAATQNGTPRTPVVWDSVDCISHLFEQAAAQSRSLRGRLMTRLELGRTRRYEVQMVRQFDQVVVSSPADRDALLRLARRDGPGHAQPNEAALATRLHVVPNGVDLDYFRPADQPRDAASIVFTGKMSYHANVTAAVHLVTEVMPRVWAQRPDATVWIVGKDPSPEVWRLASPSGAGTRRVVVTGTVPDLRPYLHKATVAVAPIPYGAGIQNKVLEAMACAAPVVASPQAVSALVATPGRDLLVAEGSAVFTDAILDLLADAPRRQALGEAGRAYVEAHHSWDAVVAKLEQVYQTAIQTLAAVG